ncbi:hypothetical protein BpPP18_10550 [Weizmannia acidilactici]|nr:hypothetical protein BpPP18_10550 [Weizmannia acidilactici]
MRMEQVLSRENLLEALHRVERNKGSHGVDGMQVSELRPYIMEHWQEIRTSLLEGAYQPQPVRRVEIPKPNGGKRKLGIPTVMDRLIQQALNQALMPIFDPEFSENSYGFRQRKQPLTVPGKGIIWDSALRRTKNQKSESLIKVSRK